MQPDTDGGYDVAELSEILMRERLFITSEQRLLQSLNEKVEQSAAELMETAWIYAQQRLNLNNLIAHRGDPAPLLVCQRAHALQLATFTDAHKVLRYQDALAFSELFQLLRETPRLLAICLMLGERSCPELMPGLIHSLCAGLYASCIHDTDRILVLRVLLCLIRHQIAAAEDPRKLVRSGTCSFNRLYGSFRDGHTPARHFLCATLHSPIMRLLHEDEFYLDIDPENTLERFSAADRLRKFGQPNSPEYVHRLSRYRKWIVTALANLAERFISALAENWACFPVSLSWIVRQTAIALKESGNVSEKEIHYICTDLVLTQYICPAIANPEPYGIIDTQMSYVARFNLKQMAQIVQTLSFMKYHDVEPKMRDLFSRFDKDCVSSLIDVLISNTSCSSSLSGIALDDFPCNGELSAAILREAESRGINELQTIKTEPTIVTNAAYFTKSELNTMVNFLQSISSSLNNNMSSKSVHLRHNNCDIDYAISGLTLYESCQTETKLLSTNGIDREFTSHGLPENKHGGGEVDSSDTSSTSSADNPDQFNNGYISTASDGLNLLVQSLDSAYKSRLHDLLKRLPDLSANSPDSQTADTPSNSIQELQPKKGLLSKVQKPKVSRTSSSITTALQVLNLDDGTGKSNGSKNGISSSSFINSERAGSVKSLRPNVLIIRLPGAGSEEPIGLLSESKIMEHYYNSQVNPTAEILESVAILDSVDLDGVEDDVLMDMVGAESVGGGPIVDGSHHGKRTRFSLSHDEVSIGNTSDNLEVVSEAASNHSVTSSLELEETEDQNDNLSDMVSANVSGRGSPNISGRDTPSSQVTEGAGEGEGGGNGNSLAPPNADRVVPSSGQNQSAASQQAKLLKQARNEIEDKFCKFEIKKLLEGDETISIISDTWSTDVLASDSETIGESCYDRSFIIAPAASAPLAAGLANNGVSSAGPNLDINGGLGGLAAVPIQLSEPSETASESAWSIDVLASDSDRMTEVDTDDCVSVTARSDSSAPAVPRPSAATPTQSAPRASHHHQVPTFDNLPPPPSSRQSRRTGGSRTTTSTGSGFVTHSHGSTSTLVNNASPIHRLTNMSHLYYNAENAIAHGGEVDFSNLQQAADQADGYSPSDDKINSISILKERKSILVNGYPVMTCFSSSRGRNDVGVAPPSPPTQDDEPVEAVQVDNPFNPFNNPEERINDPADEPGPDSGDVQQLPTDDFHHQHQAYRFEPDPWLDETVDTRPGYYKGKQNLAFRPIGSVNVPPAAENSEYKQRMIDIYYRSNGYDYGSEPSHTDTSFNSTYSSFSTSSTNPFESNFEQNTAETKPTETAASAHTTLSDLVAKMTTTLTTSASIVGNLTSRVVKSSVISISSSRIEKTLKRDKASPSNGAASNSAISLSTLSVNSADTSTSEKSSSQDVNSENVTERRVTPPLCAGNNDSNTLPRKSSTPYKPTTSTGAIPKSISFDRITEKAHSLHRRSSGDLAESAGPGLDDGKSNNTKRAGNFFNKIKLFRNRGRGMPPIDIGKRDCLDAPMENMQPSDNIDDTFIPKVDETAPKTPETIESTDDILAKYRRKPSSGGSSDSNSLPLHHKRSSKRGSVSRRSSDIISSDDALLIDDRLNGELTLDLGNPDTFKLLKKKLKMVLANPDLEYTEYLSHCCVAGTVSSWSFPSDDIGLSAMGNEALRWCRAAGNVGTRRAVADLRRDARRERKRAAYMAECRRGLLSAIARLERQHRSAQRFSMGAASTATGIRAARQLTACSALKGLTHPSSRDQRQHNGHGDSQTTPADERAARIVGTIEAITSEIRTDPEWDGAADWQLETLDRTVERSVFARVYLHVMFPNGEGDIARDQVLQDHIRRLSECGAGLPNSRCRSGASGAPWPSAQAYLAALSVYRAPTDKVLCVVRCATTIMAMLSSEEGSVPSADDFTPVLVYVIIKVNPPLLLSTIQFVNNFHILEGEGLYWWTQFCAAVQFIKTMEYNLKSPINTNI